MDITPMVSKEISDFGKEARADSAQGRFEGYTGGSASARGLLSDSGGLDRSLSYDNPTLSAIKQKYGASEFGRENKRLNLSMFRAAQEDNLRKVQVANELAGQEIEINRQKEMLRRQRKAASKAARGQLIGTALGIVGMGVGAYMGGPGAGRLAGAMVGNAVGQGAGAAMGGGL
jgi:hypothetical protein